MAAAHKAWEITPEKPVEVEVENLVEFQQALHTCVDIMMLDNFDTAAIKSTIAINQGRVKLEVSNNMKASNIREKAVDSINFLSPRRGRGG